MLLKEFTLNNYFNKTKPSFLTIVQIKKLPQTEIAFRNIISKEVLNCCISTIGNDVTSGCERRFF